MKNKLVVVVGLVAFGLLISLVYWSAFKDGWKTGYLNGKNSEFHEISLGAVEHLYILNRLQDQQELSKSIKMTVLSRIERMIFIDGYINKIGENGISYSDIQAISQADEPVYLSTLRQEEINRLRAVIQDIESSSPKIESVK